VLLSGHIFATLGGSSGVFQICKNLWKGFSGLKTHEESLRVANMCPLKNPYSAIDSAFEKLENSFF
jgi:hypothetical protein